MNIGRPHSRQIRNAWWPLVALPALLFWNATAAIADEPAALRPYGIVIVPLYQSPASDAWKTRFEDDLATILRRTRGEMWDIQWRPAPAALSGLGRLDATQAESLAAPFECDQVIFLAIEQRVNRVSLRGRCWNHTVRELSPVRSAETWNPRELPATAARLAGQLFQPILTLDGVDDEVVTLRLRAGELRPNDPAAVQVRPGDLLRVVYRYLDRDGDARQIQAVPWTYLEVAAAEREWVACRLLSGLRAPLGTNSRRRVEALAVLVRPAVEQTQVNFIRRTSSPLPLVGAEVTLRAHEAEHEDEPEPATRFTDRDGAIVLDRGEGLVWITVRSGDAQLAGVPVLAGEASSFTLELPDDGPRLRVEASLALLEGQLVDVVARRAAALARMRARARDSDWEGVTAARTEFEKLPARRQFESQLAAIRLPALEAARAAGDRLTESRVRRLCTQTEDLIRRYLDDDKLRQVLEEVGELRKLDENDPPNRP